MGHLWRLLEYKERESSIYLIVPTWMIVQDNKTVDKATVNKCQKNTRI